MDFRGTDYEDVKWNELPQDKDGSRHDMARNHQVP